MALTAKKVYAILKRQISDMEAKLNSPVRYRGTVATADLLPLNPDIGDMYNIESKSVYGEAGMNVAWNGVVWDTMGAPIDMSLYIKSSELADWVKQQNKPTYTAEEVGALPADTKIPSKTSELKNDSGFLTKVPDSYLNGTDTTLKESGKAADAKATGDKFTEMSADISKKLDKNQGSENSGKIAGINESGDIVPMFPVGVEYNEETNCLEFGSDQGMKLNQGIGLDSTLTKTGFAADAGVTGKEINSLKESISTKITKFYASSQGETNLQDSDNGKIMDMMLYGKSEQKQYSGKNLIDVSEGLEVIGNKTYTIAVEAGKSYTITLSQTLKAASSIGGQVAQHWFKFYDSSEKILSQNNFCSMNFSAVGETLAKTAVLSAPVGAVKLMLDISGYYNANPTLITNYMQLELGSEPTSYEPYTGGQPSPSPDYPQEIKSVVNPTVKVCGKNLFDKNNCYDNKWIKDLQGNLGISNGFFTTNHIFVKKGATVVIRKTGTARRGYFNISKTKFTYTESTNTTFTAIEDCWLMVSCNKAITPIEDFQIELGSTPTAYEPYHEQTVTLPYTLNAIPVNSGGNVTIDGQQYIADYVDVERGKLVRMCKEYVITGSERLAMYWLGNASYLRNVCCINNFENIVLYDGINPLAMSDMFIGKISENADDERAIYLMLRGSGDKTLAIKFLNSDGITTVDLAKQWLIEHKPKIVFVLSTPEEIDLTPEEIAALKALSTYYPTTNISVNSKQLDGYTVFNYPISMENGWNYVKQQIGDTRDYIYDMDARTQDTDLQAAEAYVNSEYAVALTELEVM